MQTQRPLGIAILSILWWIGGLFALLFGLGLILIGIAIDLSATVEEGSAFLITALLALPPLILGVASCLVGRSLWRLDAWAWWVVTVITALFVVAGLIPLLIAPALILLGIPFGLLIDVVILIYLLTPGVREAFGMGMAHRPAPRQQSAARRCPNPACGMELRGGWQYCPYCQSPLVAAVPSPRESRQHPALCPNPACRKEIRPGWNYCPYCLAAVAAGQAAALT